jgi:hypothetical protein
MIKYFCLVQLLHLYGTPTCLASLSTNLLVLGLSICTVHSPICWLALAFAFKEWFQNWILIRSPQYLKFHCGNHSLVLKNVFNIP